MNDTSTEPAETNRRPRLCIVCAIICIAALLAVLAIFRHTLPRLRPGQVVDELGTYRFPTGNRELTIDLDDSGNVHITTHQFVTEYYVIPKGHNENVYSFESERGWFISVDEYERLWVFYGRWDKVWGTLRRVPSFGDSPYAPAVIMDGMWSDGPGIVSKGGMVISENGNWDGVPKEFFDRLPDKESDAWPPQALPFPQAPPPLPKQQEEQFESLLSESR